MTNFDLRDVVKVALAICDGCASEMGVRVRDLIARSSWDELVSLRVDPSSFSSAEEYFRAYAPVAFLRKFPNLPTSFDKRGNAVKAFYEAERENYRTNQRLLPFIHNTFDCADDALADFFVCLRKEVEELIGARPPSLLTGRFGPGATYGDRGGLTTIPDKMQSRPQLTRDAMWFLVPWASTLWARASGNRGDTIEFVQGNRFTTVPKDATKDRGICIEPSINVFYQLGVGQAIRSRVLSSTSGRMDFETAQERHRAIARWASLSSSFATIDLSQASDTVSTSLVQLALPRRWFELLSSLRCRYTEITDTDGVVKRVLLEKFSSMGNGYTFELETIIFAAICSVVMRRGGVTPKLGVNLHVFGDDIILPTEFAGELITVLRYCGLKTNVDKTFVDGPFRESCGGDFFRGADVRPYFLTKDSPHEPQDFIGIANGIRRMGCNDPCDDFTRDYLRRAWFTALDFIPSSIRYCRGPSDLGDLVIHDKRSTWFTKWRHSIRYIRVYRPVDSRRIPLRVFDEDVQLAAIVYGTVVSEFRGGYNPHLIPRSAVSGYGHGWVPFS